MAAWVQWVIAAAALVTSLGILWRSAVLPAVRKIASEQVTRPVIDRIVETYKDNLNHFSVLDDIARQFTTNAGSSLKDSGNRLEHAAEESARTAHEAAVAVKGLAVEAEASRRQTSEMRVLLDDLRAQVTLGIRSVLRQEAGQQAQDAGAAVVADDLARSIGRADAEPSGEAGAAADAGLRSDPEG